MNNLHPSSSSWPSWTEIKLAGQTLPLKLKLATVVLLALCSFFLLLALWQGNQSLMVETPSSGGSWQEGVVGTPRFANPLLAVSDADRDLSTLVYSGLMRTDQNGRLIPDLASTYSVTPDGLTYTFTLREGLTWHDGNPLTTADIAFTIEKTQDPTIASPRESNWQGVNVTVGDKQHISFTLPEPRPSFLTYTTLGILPTHLWQASSAEAFTFSDFQTNPIGSGPYRIVKTKKNSAGVPEYYTLQAFENFALGEPKISELTINFFPNEDSLLKAFNKGQITSLAGLKPVSIKELNLKDTKVTTTSLPRVFGIFFNQNQSEAFTQQEVRQALDLALDKDYIVQNVLGGYGTILDGPLSPGASGYLPAKPRNNPTPVLTAADLLSQAGWKKGADGVLSKESGGKNYRLEFTLTTVDATELKEVATIAKNTWEKLGAKVEIKVLDPANLHQKAIRPRKYDALLFGMVTTGGDLYPFWHSSERLDPGLNVAMYTSPKADSLLTEIKQTTNPANQQKLVSALYAELHEDRPAIFLYSPDFIYLIPDDIQNFSLTGLTTATDRWSGIYNWYSETEKVWPWFADEIPPDTSDTITKE